MGSAFDLSTSVSGNNPNRSRDVFRANAQMPLSAACPDDFARGMLRYFAARGEGMHNSHCPQESRMITQSEDNPTNPLDGLVRGSRPGSLRSTVAAGDPLENAMSEFVRRRVKTDTASAPAGLARAGSGRTGMSNVIGLAAAITVACFAALLFVTLFPGERDLLQSFAAAAPPAPPLREAMAASKRESAREIDAANGAGMSREQSDRLLQQLVQWRQKVVVTEKQ
jgi:hypothetical protein